MSTNESNAGTKNVYEVQPVEDEPLRIIDAVPKPMSNSFVPSSNDDDEIIYDEPDRFVPRLFLHKNWFIAAP